MKSDSAAKNMDWQQVVLNGGPPCFHVEHDHGFCGRAQRWAGHDVSHKFVSLEDLIKDTRQQATLDALKEAAELAFSNVNCSEEECVRCGQNKFMHDEIIKLRTAKMKEFEK